MVQKTKKLLSIILTGLAMFGLVLTTVFCLVTPESIRKNSNGLIDTVANSNLISSSPLISTSGINSSVYDALIAKVGALETDTSKSVKNLSSINGGNPVVLKLFDNNSNSEISTFTQKYWQVVYRTGNVLTLWMVEPYTTLAFDASTKVYESSAIRQKLIYNIYPALDTIFNLDSSNIITAPGDLPVQWQTNPVYQLDKTNYSTSNTSYQAENNLMDEGCVTDKLWLPSYAEVFNNTMSTFTTSTSSLTTRNGLWQTNYQDRAYTNNSTSASAWLRSALLPVLA